MRNQVRWGRDSRGARFWIRSGNLALRSILFFLAVPVVGYLIFGPFAIGETALWVAIFGYLFILNLCIYLRGGIWVSEKTAKISAAFRAREFPLDAVAGIGLLYCTKYSALKGNKKYLRICILLKTGQWYRSVGVRGRNEFITEVAHHLADIIGWPIASSAEYRAARIELLREST